MKEENKIVDILLEIQDILKHYTDREEEYCKNSPISSVYMFHRGRQLLAVDICKTINEVFRRHSNSEQKNMDIYKEPEYKDYPYIHLEILPYPHDDTGKILIYVMRVMDEEYTINCSKIFHTKETIEEHLNSIITLAKELKMNLKPHQRII